MPLNQDHANESVHKGYHRFKKWMESFVVQWTMPEIRRKLAMAEEKIIAEWESIPDGVKAELYRQHPKDYDAAYKQYQSMKKGTNHEEVIRNIATGAGQ